MTYREKLNMERPFDVGDVYVGGCHGCPGDIVPGAPKVRGRGCMSRCTCDDCWSQEIPEEIVEEEKPVIKDSGNRREFGTGAVRDIQEGKGRCDLMPLDVVAEFYRLQYPDEGDHRSWILHYIWKFMDTGRTSALHEALNIFSTHFGNYETMFLEVAKHFEEGAKKYGEYNWQKGIPTHCYIDSAVRHYLKFLRGDKDEPHDRAFVWNILCCIWTCKYKPELNDYAKPESVQGV